MKKQLVFHYSSNITIIGHVTEVGFAQVDFYLWVDDFEIPMSQEDLSTKNATLYKLAVKAFVNRWYELGYDREVDKEDTSDIEDV